MAANKQNKTIRSQLLRKARALGVVADVVRDEEVYSAERGRATRGAGSRVPRCLEKSCFRDFTTE